MLGLHRHASILRRRNLAFTLMLPGMRAANVVRIAWMAIFLLGAAILGWLEWRSSEPSAMAWFLLSGLWSAISGIGYTVMHWYLVERVARQSESG